MINYYAIYTENKDFKAYIKRFCKNNNMTVDEALKHKIIQQIALEYIRGGCNHRN